MPLNDAAESGNGSYLGADELLDLSEELGRRDCRDGVWRRG